MPEPMEQIIPGYSAMTEEQRMAAIMHFITSNLAPKPAPDKKQFPPRALRYRHARIGLFIPGLD